MDVEGELINTGRGVLWQEFPYYEEQISGPDADIYWKFKWVYTSPPRKVGEAGVLWDPINIGEKGRTAYMYLVGQRRIKLAPEVAFDTPTTQAAGYDIYDENWIFNGSMERYHFKLIGKQEMYVPYNCYKAVYNTTKKQIFGAKHLNPGVIRWELHRVWVVEGTLRPGKRHIYQRRVIYIDEDSWTALAGEAYDSRGTLFKVHYLYLTQSYDMTAPCTVTFSLYDVVSDIYALIHWPGEGGYIRQAKVRPIRDWAPAQLAGTGIR